MSPMSGVETTLRFRLVNTQAYPPRPMRPTGRTTTVHPNTCWHVTTGRFVYGCVCVVPSASPGKDADEADNDYFLCPVRILDHAGKLLTSFPVENRLTPQVGRRGAPQVGLRVNGEETGGGGWAGCKGARLSRRRTGWGPRQV